MSKLIEAYIEKYSNDPEFIAEEIMLAFGNPELLEEAKQ